MGNKQIAGERIAEEHIAEEHIAGERIAEENITKQLGTEEQGTGEHAAWENAEEKRGLGEHIAQESAEERRGEGEQVTQEPIAQNSIVYKYTAHRYAALNTGFCENIIQEYVESHHEETIILLKKLAVIPAPSRQEEKRAAFVLEWLHNQGAAEAFTDRAGNVIFPYQCDAERELVVVMAHMDVVCPDTGTLPLRESDGCLIGPGVRDDTANLVNMMMTIKFLLTHKTEKLCNKQMPGVLFVADVGEEGLGNLKGSHQIWKDYGSRIREWICFDLNYNVIYNRAVGSRRYRISVRTEGGHSYKDFGKENAIVQLAEIITALYRVQLPQDVKVTYNVGKIEGGTTVNTIAQEAFMLYEFRSESEDGIKYMEHFMQETMQRFQHKGVCINVEILGIRPGNGMVDHKKQEALTQYCMDVIRKYYKGDIICDAGSTDGNIPLSHGIPSVTIGTAFGEGTHTRQEWVSIDSMKTGQKIAVNLIAGKTGILK